MVIKCSLGYYPVSLTATKSRRPLPGVTLKVESWALLFGSKIGSRTNTRITDSKGMAQICMGYRRHGKVSVRHPSEDLGAGKGKWYTAGNISSIRSPKTFAAVVRLPALPPYRPPAPAPTPPVIPVPVIPTPPSIPIIPITPAPGVLMGRVGAVTRLSMMDYFKDRPTFIGGAYWGCKGATRTSADIVHVAPNNDIIELQSDIDVGKTAKFRNGMSVKVTYVLLSGRSTYANVIVTPTPGILKPITPTPPTPTPPITPVPVVPEKKYKRITRILSDGQDLPKANKGENVKITAESYCVVDGKIDKSKVPSLLIIDGVVANRKPVVDGVVSYEWIATDIPSRHTICVQINPTDTCRAIGRDCKKISVSSRELDPSEQLLRERTSAREQRELIKLSRTKLRQEIVSRLREAPVYEEPLPTPTILPVVSPVVTPIEKPPVPQTGSIKLTGLPLAIPEDIPAYVYIDNINKGIISIIPVTLSSIPIGTHSVYVKAGEFKSISKSVEVLADKTTTVSLL